MTASVRRYGKSSRAYCGVQGNYAAPCPGQNLPVTCGQSTQSNKTANEKEKRYS